MVMEFLEGESLREAIEHNRTGDFSRRMQIGLQVGRAIGHIHQKKIIHRDIKPENVNVDAFGRAKLMDFGIAKADNMRLTRTGMTLGTPYYMSPGTSSWPGRHYAGRHLPFGVLMFELLTGKKPIQGENIQVIFQRFCTNRSTWSRYTIWAFRSRVVKLVEKCVAKNPADR